MRNTGKRRECLRAYSFITSKLMKIVGVSDQSTILDFASVDLCYEQVRTQVRRFIPTSPKHYKFMNLI